MNLLQCSIDLRITSRRNTIVAPLLEAHSGLKRVCLDRIQKPEQLASRLIAIAFSLVGSLSKVREYMQCSEGDFLDYCEARKAPSKVELERLVELISREQSNINR